MVGPILSRIEEMGIFVLFQYGLFKVGHSHLCAFFFSIYVHGLVEAVVPPFIHFDFRMKTQTKLIIFSIAYVNVQVPLHPIMWKFFEQVFHSILLLKEINNLFKILFFTRSAYCLSELFMSSMLQIIYVFFLIIINLTINYVLTYQFTYSKILMRKWTVFVVCLIQLAWSNTNKLLHHTIILKALDVRLLIFIFFIMVDNHQPSLKFAESSVFHKEAVEI